MITVTVTVRRVVYLDERGRRGYAQPGEITGPWPALEAALARAEAARQTLLAAAGDRVWAVWLANRRPRGR
jgi:hypothetical protein